MTAILRLRKDLADPLPAPIWPVGAQLLPLSATDPRRLHAILIDA